MLGITLFAAIMATAGSTGCATGPQPGNLAVVTGGAGARPAVPMPSTANPDGGALASSAPLVASADSPAERRSEVVVYDTAIFLLSTEIELDKVAPAGEQHVLSWSDCVTPADEDGCCWQWLTACAEDEDSCRFHVVHGCYLAQDDL